jgi:hypothetical protein
MNREVTSSHIEHPITTKANRIDNRMEWILEAKREQLATTFLRLP